MTANVTCAGWGRGGERQRVAFKPDYKEWSERPVIIATNAAETGVTFDNCMLVVDTCLVNVVYHEPSTNVKVQATMPCSNSLLISAPEGQEELVRADAFDWSYTKNGIERHCSKSWKMH